MSFRSLSLLNPKSNIRKGPSLDINLVKTQKSPFFRNFRKCGKRMTNSRILLTFPLFEALVFFAREELTAISTELIPEFLMYHSLRLLT